MAAANDWGTEYFKKSNLSDIPLDMVKKTSEEIVSFGWIESYVKHRITTAEVERISAASVRDLTQSLTSVLNFYRPFFEHYSIE